MKNQPTEDLMTALEESLAHLKEAPPSCESCGKTRPKGEAIARAVGWGWRYAGKNEEWFCPDCIY